MKRILFVFIIPLLTTWSAKAQEELAPINTGVANFLTLTTDARSAGMGGANVALSESNNAIFYNAASSVINTQTCGVGYSFAPVMRAFESGYSLNSIGAFYKLDKRNVILAGFRYYHYPKVEGIAIDDENTLNGFHPKEWSIDVSYAREIIPNLAVSLTTRFIHSDMGTFGGAKSANAFAFDLGAIYQQDFDFMEKASWTTGLQVSNIGSKIKYLNTSENLPAFAKIGGSADVSFTPIHRQIATVDIGYIISPADIRSPSFSTGAE